MTVTENISLLKRWYREVWAEGKNETVHEILAADAVLTGQRGAQVTIHGPSEFCTFADEIRRAFPNTELTVEEVFGVDDKVVARWSATMTHSGEGMGEPTGKPVRITGMTIARFRDGKIVEGWDSWDQLGMLEQIGAVSVPRAEILAKTA